METKKQKLDKVFERNNENNLIHEAVVLIENTNGDFTYQNSYGEKEIDTPMPMASITKLLTTTCIFILREQGKLSLNDKVTKYFQEDTLNKLHIYKGKEYSTRLTLLHLLLQTSGLPDIFEEGRNNRKKRVIQADMSFSFEEVITMTKDLKPHFAPETKKRAHYADVNFDMLGEVIEQVTNLPLDVVYKQLIFDPLALKSTYLPKNDHDFIPTIFYKDSVLHRPHYMKSCRASGGGVSTVRELMIFIKAFFGGELFNKTVFHELKVANKLQFSMYPIRYSAGYMSIPLHGLATFFMGKGELLGHSGSSGSFAFYYPLKELFIVGDVNQIANPSLPVRLAMRLAISI